MRKLLLTLALAAFLPLQSNAQSLLELIKRVGSVINTVQSGGTIAIEDIAAQAANLGDIISGDITILDSACVVVDGRRAPGRYSISRVGHQTRFHKNIPAGNYSGIAWLGDNLYALADDKSATDGFRLVEISIDETSGAITGLKDKGFMSSGLGNRDGEGIVYVPSTKTVFMSGEADNRILEYNLDGSLTGRELPSAEIFGSNGNSGLEALAYEQRRGTFWTTTEGAIGEDKNAFEDGSLLLRVQSFRRNLSPGRQYLYHTDAPVTENKAGGTFVFGVSEMTSIGRGRFLVMERESFIPSSKVGAYSINKIYVASRRFGSEELQKDLLISFRTNMNLSDMGFANYEGMCLGPKLADGSRVLILCADSQARYYGVLSDWFLTLNIKGL